MTSVKPSPEHSLRPAHWVLLGPAMVAAAAYVDPGNVASNTTAGARYGYLLVWVVVGANVMAGLVQYLSAKLGIVTGRSLPEVLGDRLSHGGRLAYWLQAELVTMATDIAEVLGGAIALALLFDLPLLWGGVVTAVVSMALLGTRDRGGPRRFERLIIGMLGVVAVGFVAGLLVAPPDGGAVADGLLPAFAGGDSVLLAAAMLGATVMPHAVYAHSALARDRHGQAFGPRRARLLAATRVDVTIALLVAGAVNLGLLLLGATTLSGDTRSDTIEGVHAAIGDHLGAGVALLFAIGLLCSGLASTAVGCYSGSVVMGGLLRRSVPLVTRRAITAIPALAVLAAGVEPTTALIVSQVVLSFGIPFALVPLVGLTSRRAVMGTARNHPATVLAAAAVCTAIVGLNAALLVLTFMPG
jgi:manganese transport protein